MFTKEKTVLFLLKSVALVLVLVFGVTALWPVASFAVEETAQRKVLNPKKMIVLSDPHYYAPELGTTGPAFERYLDLDKKLLAESDAIFRKVVETVKNSDAGIVLVTGDLTKDGELVSHEKLAAYLREIKDSGRKVYVINGNHDISNPHALRFDGENVFPVPSVSPEDFKSIYWDFGYSEAIAIDPGSLSYVVEPVKGLRIVAMDSALYNRNYLQGEPLVGGAFPEVRLNWILQQVKSADAEAKTVLGMMHHGLLEHFSVQRQFFGEYVIEDGDYVAAQLAEAGMSVVFTGHFHAQDIVKKQFGDKVIYDVETASLVGYPCSYRIVELTGNNKLSITSARIEEIVYDTGGIPFPVYARTFLIDGIRFMVPYILTDVLIGQGVPPAIAFDQAKAIAQQEIASGLTVSDLMIVAMLAHYEGDEQIDPTMMYLIQGIAQSEDPTIELLGSALLSLVTDLEPGDNEITIKLNKKVK